MISLLSSVDEACLAYPLAFDTVIGLLAMTRNVFGCEQVLDSGYVNSPHNIAFAAYPDNYSARIFLPTWFHICSCIVILKVPAFGLEVLDGSKVLSPHIRPRLRPVSSLYEFPLTQGQTQDLAAMKKQPKEGRWLNRGFDSHGSDCGQAVSLTA